MDNVLIVFKTDVWHTQKSQEMLGVFSSFKIAIKAINMHLGTEKENALSLEEVHQLENMNQTQTEEDRDFEFVLESVPIDQLL